MLAKNYLILFIRRRRHYLLRLSIIILSVYLFFQIKYSSIDDSLSNNTFINIPTSENVLFNKTNSSLSKNTFINVPTSENVLFKKPMLNCSGEPLIQWCQNELKLCDLYLIVYNNLFAVTHSIILQPEFAKGKRIGGENIQDVLNQPEKDEYFQFEKQFIKVKFLFFFIKLK
jgi:hypothetical protein